MDKPHKKLFCRQKRMELVVEVYRFTEAFPKHEIYGLTSQIRRAAVSVPANISKGAADRTSSHFRNYLAIAVGSLNELRALLEIAFRVGYVDKGSHDRMQGLVDHCLALTSV